MEQPPVASDAPDPERVRREERSGETGERRLDDYLQQIEDIFDRIEGMLTCRDLDSLEARSAEVYTYLVQMAVTALGGLAGELRQRNPVDEALPRRATFVDRRGLDAATQDLVAGELARHDPLGEEGKEPWASLVDRLDREGFRPLRLSPRVWLPRSAREGDLPPEADAFLASVGSVAVIPLVLRDHRARAPGKLDRERLYGIELVYLKEPVGAGGERIEKGLARLKKVGEVVLTNRVAIEGLLKRVATFRHQTKGKDLAIQGSSLAVVAVRQRLDELARSGVDRIRIEGPRGAGKKHVAERFHRLGPGASNPFVAVDCARVSMGPEGSGPSDYAFRKRLFGDIHAEDLEDAMGAFEQARGGTLFLDEVEHLPPSFQYKLAQVLQEGRFSRPGEDGHVQVDCSIVLASEADLEEAAAERRFSAKLLRPFRKAPRIRIPGLNERREDIPALVDAFFARQVRSQKKHRLLRIDPRTMRLLVERDWSLGNVKAVQNLIGWAVARARPEDAVLLPEHLPEGTGPFSASDEDES